jgi:hypothetical protein
MEPARSDAFLIRLVQNFITDSFNANTASNFIKPCIPGRVAPGKGCVCGARIENADDILKIADAPI